MRRLIDEYGLAILYAIVGILCLFIFGWLFLGDDNDFSKVISNVVDKTTDSTSNITYDIEYDLNGGYYDIKEVQDGLTLKCNKKINGSCRITKLSDILGFDGDDAEGQEENKKYRGAQKDASGARYYELANGNRLWITYTKDKSFVIPAPSHLDEGAYKIFFDGWTSSSLNVRTRNVIIPKGSTGTKKYTANWTKGKYKVTFEPGLEELKGLPKYNTALSNGFNLNSLLSGDTSDLLVEFSTGKITFPANAYKLIGHKFMYWTDAVTKEKYYPGTTYTISEPERTSIDEDSYISGNGLSFYAVWELETYKLNYINWKATKSTDINSEQQNVSNDNPQGFEETYINYTVLDDFDLEKATMPGFENGEWYTVNPYLYNGNAEEIQSKLFGTYSFKGNNTDAYFFGQYNELPESDMLSNGWNKTVNVYSKSNGSLTANAEYKKQHVSYGTYGDITLYSFFSKPKTYQIKLYEKHYDYTVKESSKKTQPSWIETESEPKLIGLINFKFDSTIEEIFNFTLTTERSKDFPYDSSSTSNFAMCGIPYDEENRKCTDFIVDAETSNASFDDVLNQVFKSTLKYEFEGFEDANGNLVFAYTKTHQLGSQNSMAFAAVGEQSLYWSLYSSVQNLVDVAEGAETTTVTNRYHWAYPENLTLYARWTPMTYIVKLHSNY